MLQNKERVRHIAAVAAAIVVLAVILWIDIATGLWQEVVILAGIAAGLVTFVLTVVVLDRIVARSTARRWAPVTRLALTQFLHVLADEERSEISQGVIHPRFLPGPPAVDHLDLADRLQDLRIVVVEERARLADVLGTWSSFLASSSDNENLLIRIANIALQLDRVRDESLEFEQHRSALAHAALAREIAECNVHFRGMTEDIEARLEGAVAPLIPGRVPHDRVVPPINGQGL